MTAPATESGWRTWPARDPKTRLLAGIVLLVLAVRDAAGIVEFFRRADVGHPDFFGLWSFARFVLERPAAEIYATVQLQAFQWALDPAFTGFYPFAYPPPMLLLLPPLGLLPFSAARGAFVLLTLAGFALIVVRFAGARGAPAKGGAWGVAWAVAVAAVVAPASVYTAFVGQNGLFFGALLLGGLVALPTRPVLAGALFGLLACKPQYGLLLPVALLAAGAWRAIAATVATVAALSVVVTLVFGVGVWSAWVAALPEFSAMFTAQLETFLPLMASPAAGLVRLGAGQGVAVAVQAVVTVALGIAVWLLFRRNPGRAACAALLPAVGLASPYVFIYDQPIAVACLAWLFADRWRRDGAFSLAEVAVMLAALLAPAFLLHPWLELPIVAASLAALFVVAARHAWTVSGDNSRDTAPKTVQTVG